VGIYRVLIRENISQKIFKRIIIIIFFKKVKFREEV
jgi:hypothetical protein